MLRGVQPSILSLSRSCFRSPELARQEGLEPPTHSLEGCCSIHLSYWRFVGAEVTAIPPLRRALPRNRPAAQRIDPRKVGATGFEPVTSCSQSRRDTRLRYAPHKLRNLSPLRVTVNGEHEAAAVDGEHEAAAVDGDHGAAGHVVTRARRPGAARRSARERRARDGSRASFPAGCIRRRSRRGPPRGTGNRSRSRLDLAAR